MSFEQQNNLEKQILEQNQERQIALLKKLSNLFKDNNIKWWLTGGHAIEANIAPDSAYRPHGDLDIIIPITEIEKVKSILASQNITYNQDLPFRIMIEDDNEKIADLLFYEFTEDGSAILNTESRIGRNIIYRPTTFSSTPKEYLGSQIFTVRPELIYLQLKNSQNPREKDSEDLEQLEKLIDPQIIADLEIGKPYVTSDEMARAKAKKKQ